MNIAWYVILLSTICLEGLGRRYLPMVPGVAFYFLKDVVLLFGLYWFRPSADVRRMVTYLYRGFGVVLILAIAWTVLEMFNPAHQSFVLALIGLRAYWLWWLAPMVVAGLLQHEHTKRRAIVALLVMSTGIAILAALQFAAPADSALNVYSVVDGEEQYANQIGATGRARVASTFSYISGFSDFSVLVPTILLSLGLDIRERRLQKYVLLVTSLTAIVLPMSGSRTSVLLAIVALVTTAFAAGLFFTRIGRRVLIGAIVASILAVSIFPDAILGVQSRFNEDADETSSRYTSSALAFLPPVAIATYEYPPFGIGTGMLQNARYSMHITTEWEVELEVGRYLAELGPVGFLLVWTAKLGLTIALLRAYRILKNAGKRGAAAAALSYALLTMAGNLAYDHIWQALYFTGCGFILAEVVAVSREHSRAAVVSPRSAGLLVPAGS
jgi:hypothetical protein